jgi:hypothetical protein
MRGSQTEQQKQLVTNILVLGMLARDIPLQTQNGSENKMQTQGIEPMMRVM